MRRRDFIALLGGVAVALPLNAGAQPLDQMRRIGVLIRLAEDDPEGQSDIAALREGFNQHLVPCCLLYTTRITTD